MEKAIVTAYGRLIAISEIKEFFTEVFIRDETDPPHMVGAIMKNGEVVCIARIWNNDLKAMLFSSLYGIFRNPKYDKPVFNTNIELETLKELLEMIEYITHDGFDYEVLVRSTLFQLMYGVTEDKYKGDFGEDDTEK